MSASGPSMKSSAAKVSYSFCLGHAFTLYVAVRMLAVPPWAGMSGCDSSPGCPLLGRLQTRHDDGYRPKADIDAMWVSTRRTKRLLALPKPLPRVED